MSDYLVDLNKLEAAFCFKEGFSRPNWQLIGNHVEQTVESKDLNKAWTQIAWQWAARLKDDLGGDYQVTESTGCILLSTADDKSRGRMLALAERAAGIIPERLGAAAYSEGYGKHLLLLFEDEDDYYQYISYYSDAGQTASLDYLGKDLGEVVTGVLGEGNWRPNRKCIADLFKKYAEERAHAQSDKSEVGDNSRNKDPAG